MKLVWEGLKRLNLLWTVRLKQEDRGVFSIGSLMNLENESEDARLNFPLSDVERTDVVVTPSRKEIPSCVSVSGRISAQQHTLKLLCVRLRTGGDTV